MNPLEASTDSPIQANCLHLAPHRAHTCLPRVCLGSSERCQAEDLFCLRLNSYSRLAVQVLFHLCTKRRHCLRNCSISTDGLGYGQPLSQI